MVFIRQEMIFLKGAIFDIDGTILDSMAAWIETTNKFFKSHGVNISEEKALSYQTMSFEESLSQIQHDYLPHIDTAKMLGEFSRLYKEECENGILPKPYAVEYIKSLHDKGVKLAVATSGFPDIVKKSFTRLGIYDYFDAFAFSSEVGCSKSNPDIYLLAAKRLGLKPCECTVYEDILTGIKSAGAAGFKTVAIEDISNASDKQGLIQHSDRYITGWSELLSNI